MHGKPRRTRPRLDQPVRQIRREEHPVAAAEIEAFVPNFENRRTFGDQHPFVV
jgi:hypothetical protein